MFRQPEKGPGQVNSKLHSIETGILCFETLTSSEDLLDNERDKAVYNTMPIQWENDVAYRKGLAQIHKMSFDRTVK